MKTFRLLPGILSVGAGIMVGSNSFAGEPVNSIRFVPDVVGQFNALTERPDPIGFYRGASPDPTSCKHYQGMVRVQAADGTPYLYVTRSGNLPTTLPLPDLACADIGTEDDQPGNLLIVKMESRDRNGERLRSNRLAKGADLVNTAPDLRDRTVKHFTFNGGEWGNYGHPGGMQAVGDILVVALEASYSSDFPETRFLFLNIADPENPVIVNKFDPPAGVLSGLVGITPQANGRYLMVVTGGKDVILWFFESKPTDGTADGPTDLTSPLLDWRLIDEWVANPGTEVVEVSGVQTLVPALSPDEVRLGQNWPTDSAHQTLHFIREGDINGPLFLAGARGTFGFGEDRRDLYRVLFENGEVKLELASSQHVNSHPNADGAVASPGNNTANLAAASAYYVSPSGELIFYATEHDNDGAGPLIGVVNNIPIFDKSIKAGEWRHRDMVRPNSPTLLPTVQLFGEPYEVNEGDTTTLAGLGAMPITKAWMQLFSDDNFTGRYIVIDFLDWRLDDFNDFKELEGSNFDLHRGFNDEATSVRWFAPSNTQLRLNDNHIGDDPFPGDSTRVLDGFGEPRSIGHLGSVDDSITSAEFLDSVGFYYSGRPDLFWDVNLDGSFSASGEIVTFSAGELDGPNLIFVPVKAVHPDDGLAGLVSARVQINNVAPTIVHSTIHNSLGHELGVDVPFFLLGLPLTFTASFTDPGKPDHQIAAIQWDIGVVDANSSFEAFSDAFGGVTGQIKQSHLYPTAGEFNVVLTVTDDDGGGTSAPKIVPVLTPEEALEESILDLNELISQTTDQAVLRLLKDAMKALAGSHPPQSQNGALVKLDLNNKRPALVKLNQALDSLQAAAAKGADVAMLIAILEQVIASVEA